MTVPYDSNAHAQRKKKHHSGERTFSRTGFCSGRRLPATFWVRARFGARYFDFPCASFLHRLFLCCAREIEWVAFLALLTRKARKRIPIACALLG